MTPVKVRNRATVPNVVMRSEQSRTTSAPKAAGRLRLAIGACVLLASCATSELRPYPQPLYATQDLALRTDPAGAHCTISRDGTVVASVEATPGVVAVRRDFCSLPFDFWSTPEYCKGPLERVAPIEVSCRKDGYLEVRKTFHEASTQTVQSEEGPQSEPSAGSEAISGLAIIGMATGPLGILILAPTALAVAVANADQPPNYAYAYRALPEFFLTPETFPSEAVRDAFFAALPSKLEQSAKAKQAYIDKQCRFWPCKAGDPEPCKDPVCEQRRARVDAELKALLDDIPALREQTRIVAP